MKIIKTKIKDLVLVKTNIFKDNRGFFKEDFKKIFFKNQRFVFGCTSSSKKNVLRGLHLQTKNSQEKFVSVIKSKILDVVIDLRKKSQTFGKNFQIILSEKNAKSILIPSGCAHGFLGLDNENIVVYSNNNYRSKKSEIGLLWNDPKLKIKWPRKKLIISKKDKNNLKFIDFCRKYKI